MYHTEQNVSAVSASEKYFYSEFRKAKELLYLQLISCELEILHYSNEILISEKYVGSSEHMIMRSLQELRLSKFIEICHIPWSFPCSKNIFTDYSCWQKLICQSCMTFPLFQLSSQAIFLLLGSSRTKNKQAP